VGVPYDIWVHRGSTFWEARNRYCRLSKRDGRERDADDLTKIGEDQIKDSNRIILLGAVIEADSVTRSS
jgi:hypothetical protein